MFFLQSNFLELKLVIMKVMSLKFLSENIWIILLIRMAHVLSLQDLFEILASGEIWWWQDSLRSMLKYL